MSRSHLLLVDNDVQGLQILEVSLRKAGFQVTSTSDGSDALLKAQALLPDLVLSEIDLPSLGGFDLLETLRKSPTTASIPVVFLTQDASVERRVRALELGVADYLSKPIYIKEIVARVRIHLQRRAREVQATQPAQELEGGLSDMGLVDLLQTIRNRSAIVTCTSGRGETATVWLRDGRVCDAILGKLSGEHAFYRLLNWNDGSYTVRFEAHDRATKIPLETPALLMEGMRRLDEWGRLLEGLPGLDAVFEVDFVALAFRLGEIPDEVNAVLRLVDGRRDLRQVVEESPFEDSSTLSVVARLHADGIVRTAWVAADRPAMVPLRAPAGWTGTPAATEKPAPSAPAPSSDSKSALPVGADGKPLRGAALARALAQEAKKRIEAAAPAPAAPAAAPGPTAAQILQSDDELVVTLTQPAAAPDAAPSASTDPFLAPVAAAAAKTDPDLTPPSGTPIFAAGTFSAPGAPCQVCGTVCEASLAFCPSCGTATGQAAAVVPASSGEEASTWAGPAVEAPPPATSPLDLAKLLAGDGPSAPAAQDTTARIPVVRYPGRRGSRRARLEQEAREARDLAKSRHAGPIALNKEVLRPGARPSPEILARIAAAQPAAEAVAPVPVPETPVESATSSAPDADAALRTTAAAPAPTSLAAPTDAHEIAEPLRVTPAPMPVVVSSEDVTPKPSLTFDAHGSDHYEPALIAASASTTSEEPAPIEPSLIAAPEPAPEPRPALAARRTAPAVHEEDEELAAFLKSRKKRAPRIAAVLGVVVIAGVVATFTALRDEEPKAPEAPLVAAGEPAPAPMVKPAEPVVAAAEPAIDAGSTTAAIAPPQPPVVQPAMAVVEPTKPAEVAKPIEIAKPVEPVKPAEPVKPIEVAKVDPPKEPTKPAEPRAEIPKGGATDEFERLLAAGIAANGAERFGSAITSLSKALKMHENAVAHRELGNAYYNSNKPDLARMHLAKATSLDDKDADAFLYLGMVSQELEKEDDAKKAYRRFLALEPKSSPRWAEISSVLKNIDR